MTYSLVDVTATGTLQNWNRFGSKIETQDTGLNLYTNNNKHAS